jgi:hypothetical protein
MVATVSVLMAAHILEVLVWALAYAIVDSNWLAPLAGEGEGIFAQNRLASEQSPSLQCWHRADLHHTCSLMLPLGFRRAGYRGDKNERANRA